MKRHPLVLLTALSLGRLLANDATDFPPKPPVKALTPAEEQKTFQLPPGYRMELILSEPDITEPVCIAFDGNGRLYVAEMSSYMRDIDGTDELASICCKWVQQRLCEGVDGGDDGGAVAAAADSNRL
jgi:hypothetical protein